MSCHILAFFIYKNTVFSDRGSIFLTLFPNSASHILRIFLTFYIFSRYYQGGAQEKNCGTDAEIFCKCFLNTHPPIFSHMLQKNSMHLAPPTPLFFHFAYFFTIYDDTHPIFCSLSYLKSWFYGI